MEANKLKALSAAATRIRMAVVEGTFHAKSGHPGGSLSIADVLAYLYTGELRIDPARPDWEDRDRFVMSKGHCAPALYGALALRGFFPEEEIRSLRHIDAMLQGHPCMTTTPGVDMSTGSLGQGVSTAVGMALGARLDNKDFRVYAILGDGEIQEGQVWEAAMFAAHKKLSNLCVIVDNNDLQIDGTMLEVNSPYPIPEKFAAFGFNVVEIDGHDFDQIEKAFAVARTCTDKPTAIVMKTTKGRGVSFMENQVGWHGKGPNAEEHAQAMHELRVALAAIEEG